MRHRTLPGTEQKVSSIALDCKGFGGEIEVRDSFSILDRFVEAGGDLVDAENVVGGDGSEEVLGRWLASRPSDITGQVVVATKALRGTEPREHDVGATRRHFASALDASLTRLGRDHVDIYQLHGWDQLSPIGETLISLADAIGAGKVSYFGLSHFTSWQIRVILSTAEALGMQSPVTLQAQYGLTSRQAEFDTIPVAVHNNVGVLPWSPLHTQCAEPGLQRETFGSSRFGPLGRVSTHDDTVDDVAATGRIDDVVRAIARDVSATASQVALSWVSNRPAVLATVVGARTVYELDAHLAATDLVLDVDALDTLDEVSAPISHNFPYGSFGSPPRDRYNDRARRGGEELP